MATKWWIMNNCKHRIYQSIGNDNLIMSHDFVTPSLSNSTMKWNYISVLRHNQPIVIIYAWLPFTIQVNCHFLNSQLSVTKQCPKLEIPSFFLRISSINRIIQSFFYWTLVIFVLCCFTLISLTPYPEINGTFLKNINHI